MWVHDGLETLRLSVRNIFRRLVCFISLLNAIPCGRFITLRLERASIILIAMDDVELSKSAGKVCFLPFDDRIDGIERSLKAKSRKAAEYSQNIFNV